MPEQMTTERENSLPTSLKDLRTKLIRVGVLVPPEELYPQSNQLDSEQRGARRDLVFYTLRSPRR